MNPYDPNPPKTYPDPTLGTREGWWYCHACCGIQPPDHTHPEYPEPQAPMGLLATIRHAESSNTAEAIDLRAQVERLTAHLDVATRTIARITAERDGAVNEAAALRRERDTERKERHDLTWAIAAQAEESCDGHNGHQLLKTLEYQRQQAVAAAAKTEREECAKAALKLAATDRHALTADYLRGYDDACADEAEAIRGRGGK